MTPNASFIGTSSKRQRFDSRSAFMKYVYFTEEITAIFFNLPLVKFIDLLDNCPVQLVRTD